MAHTYYEDRKQPTPDVQKRKYCPECHREWIEFKSSVGRSDICPGCSNEAILDIDVPGQYDSQTDPADIARALAGIPLTQLAEEQEARQRLVHLADVSEPPPALLASVGLPVPVMAAFAPELD